MRLSAPLVPGGNVQTSSFVITPDARAVLYFADQEEDNAMELFMSFLAGPVSARRPR